MNRKILFVIIGAIVLCFMGLDNKYPFLTLDSGIFINSGFSKEVPADRSILYGIFTAHAGWGKSLWLVIFTQALLLSLILFYYFRYFSQNAKYPIYYLAAIFFISFCTSASVITSTIYPGVFGGIALLTIGLLLFAKKLTNRDFAIISIVAIVSIGMDLSYFVITLIVLMAYGLWMIFQKKKPHIIGTNVKRLFLTAVYVIAGFILICAVHFYLGAGFSPVKNKQMVIMARVASSGEAEKYLRNACQSKNLNLCAYYKDAENILTSSGRIKPAFHTPEYIKEFQKVTGKMVSSQNFEEMIAKRGLQDFSRLLTNLGVSAYKRIGDSTITVQAINKHYREVRECIFADQVRNELSFSHLSTLQMLLIPVLMLLLFLIYFYKKASRYRNITVYILLSIFIYLLGGAFFYGNQINILSQVIWLLPIPLFLYSSDKDLIFRKWNV